MCAKSIHRRASQPVHIYPLRQDWLRSLGIYWRARDPLASTEFTYTRFLVPALCGYHGPAVFIDADFLVLSDIVELFDAYNPLYAVSCVQHDYCPRESTKMGGIPQSRYPRKNWSSLLLFNTGHHIVHERLTPNEVNTRSGAYLHRLEWCPDAFLGVLPKEWNTLEGEDHIEKPKAVHFTRGIPGIHPGTFDYEALWHQEERA